jgi:cyclopropane fatty-acyl-phospholipid synthase-like methyltransferase
VTILRLSALAIIPIGVVAQTSQIRPPVLPPLTSWSQHLVEVLQIKPGDTVVDIGAGVGGWLQLWSAAAGPGGHVIAEDISKWALERARKTVENQKVSNVDFILGTPKDPELPNGCADLIIVMEAYHEFEFPADMLAHLTRALKRNGRLAIIDLYRSDLGKKNFPPKGHVRLEKDEAIAEIESRGFRLLRTEDRLGGRFYLAIFESGGPTGRHLPDEHPDQRD